MIITCPTCGLSSDASEDRLPAGRFQASCPRCRSKFPVTKSMSTAIESPAETGQQENVFECPKCQAQQPPGEVCARCGVVFKKIGVTNVLSPKRDTLITGNMVSSLLGIGFSVFATVSLEPTSILNFFVLTAWTSMPFLVSLNIASKKKTRMGVGVHLSLAVWVIGFLDIRYLHPDPQGGIAILMLTFICLAIIGASIAIVNAKKAQR